MTITPPHEPWRHRALNTEALAVEQLAVPAAGASVTTLVASGPALSSFAVSCEAGPGAVGPVAVRGPSIGIDGHACASLADTDGWYDTGDVGLVVEPASRQPLTSADTHRLRNDVRRAAVRITAAQPEEIVVVERGALPLTSSGKLQRHEVRARILRGKFVP